MWLSILATRTSVSPAVSSFLQGNHSSWGTQAPLVSREMSRSQVSFHSLSFLRSDSTSFIFKRDIGGDHNVADCNRRFSDSRLNCQHRGPAWNFKLHYVNECSTR